MQTKLTLRLDDALIERAKTLARQIGLSLSGAVASSFSQLSGGGRKPGRLSPWTRSLSGVARSDGPPPSDRAIRDERLAHLDRKHR